MLDNIQPGEEAPGGRCLHLDGSESWLFSVYQIFINTMDTMRMKSQKQKKDADSSKHDANPTPSDRLEEGH